MKSKLTKTLSTGTSCHEFVGEMTLCSVLEDEETVVKWLKLQQFSVPIALPPETDFTMKALMLQEHLNAIYNLWPCTVNIKKLTDEEIRKHTGKYALFMCNLRCPKCNVAISCAASLTHHMKAEHKGFKIDCGTCGKEYSSIEALCKHAKEIHSMDKFRCEKCDRTFAF